MRNALLLGVLLGLFGSAQADSFLARVDCRHPETQAGATVCAEHETATVESQLDSRFASLAARYDAQDRALLETAQRQWQAFRDAECAFQTSGSEGGTIHRQLVAECRTRLDKRRLADLEALAKCGTDDLSCNAPN